MPETATFNVALISMPWSIFNRPSIQLGALQAYLEQEEGLAVENFHPYLSLAKDLTPETYQRICENSWVGEALYASILFPERKENAKTVFRKYRRRNNEIALSFESLRETLQAHLQRWVAVSDFRKYPLIGFTVCFSQLFSSLTAAAAIKEKMPEAVIVFGGSSCVGQAGISLLRHFPQIDYIIEGEGEIPLVALCRFLQQKRNSLPKQIHCREKVTPMPCNAVKDLNTLPTPNYSHYFKELNLVFPGHSFIPALPLEFSRGCWWGKCTFCNLNLQWHGYRKKSAGKVSEELHYLVKTHRCLDFCFCDNALPVKESDAFFEAIRNNGFDVHFFAEIRAVKGRETLKLYRQGGLTAVQVGIESLSNSLLKKMKKGVTVIENLAIMKHCLENDIQLDGNLIVEFPGSTADEVAETLKNLDYALPFRPLSSAAFFLGTGSPIHRHRQNFGLGTIVHHPCNRKLVPPELLGDMEMLIMDYQGNKNHQTKLWKPVKEKIKSWQRFYQQRKNTKVTPLSYRDGGTFIIIRQEQQSGPTLLHRLQGTSRDLYLFCNTIRTMAEILQGFPTLAEKTILNFFSDLCIKNLLYREDRSFLALAIGTSGRHDDSISTI